MVDKDTMDYIDKQIRNADKESRDVAVWVANNTKTLSMLTNAAYNHSEEDGMIVLSSILLAILVAASKSNDQAIIRLDKLYEYTRKDIIALDRAVYSEYDAKI